MSERNIAASVRTRLLNHAKSSKQSFDLVLTHYAIERLLYRISISEYAEQFLLKGALLFTIWFNIPHRATRDADLLGFGSSELAHIEAIFREICCIEDSDGIRFLADSLKVAEIRLEANYAGVRVNVYGLLDTARCSVQVDIGFGDAVTPAPECVEYPVILHDFISPKLRAYPRYTVVAEKLEALTSLGIANSRLKDYFDLWVLAQQADFDGDTLRLAIQATFARRGTPLTGVIPFGLSSDFAQDRQKQMQWHAFLKKNQLSSHALDHVVEALNHFLSPIIAAVTSRESTKMHWQAGGPWRLINKSNL